MKEILVYSFTVLTTMAHAVQSYDQLKIAVFAALVPVVVAFVFIVFLLYRKRRETYLKQKELQLKLDMAEMEMKALRAQVNPHFIFNCLNSIQHYLHKKDTLLAEEYLIKFSRLIRLTLENSSFKTISLEDELNALKLYIAMEQLRLDHSFTYHIVVEEAIDQAALYIPPLLIQPFVENAIWHGLHNVPDGKVSVEIVCVGDLLKCTIQDNGLQKPVRKRSPVDEAKKKSLGLSLINDRLALLNSLNNTQARFVVYDRRHENPSDSGKRIELFIPYE